MTTARDAILRSVRIGLKRGALDDNQRAALDTRVPHHTRPAFDEDLIERFIRKFESRAGTVVRVSCREEVAAAVEAYRASLNLPERAAIGAALKDLTWPQAWSVNHGPATVDETMAVTAAVAGVAETGSLMLCGGPDSPTTHNFVPDDHVVVLEAGQIVRHFEDAWTVLRARTEGLPRATNFVSGPSRTADVEQTIQLGAHGPRRVHIVLIGS